MILRAKNKTLFEGKALTDRQRENTQRNIAEMERGGQNLLSYPRRLVLELTNACNLNCVMCGRNAADFKLAFFDMEVFKSLEPLMDTVEEVTLMGWGEPTVHPNFIEMLRIIDHHHARKYFCTNGMRLDKIFDAIFDYKVDVFAVSVDGATNKTNNAIRRGSNLRFISEQLKKIEYRKNNEGLSYPYINFVFCAMKSNLHELPDLVKVAAEIGIDEVKVVFLTVFEDAMLPESLWGLEDEIRSVFNEAVQLGEELGILLKLPYVPGEDVAGEKLHRDCFVAWRDFFVGSDGFVRPCMSTPVKLFAYDIKQSFIDMWNSQEYQKYRAEVNDGEKMDEACKRCYQSSHCNWNRQRSFIQVGEQFSPEWEK